MQLNELLALPKIDLHCHLDGSINLGLVSDLLGREVAPSELQVAEDCKSLAEYLHKFDLPLQCMNTAAGLYRTAKQFMLDLRAENVVYVEARFAPLQSANQNISAFQVMEAVIDGMEAGRQETGIDYGVIACVMRHHALDDSRQMIRDINDFWGHGLCALDLAGDEAAYPMSMFSDLFASVAKEGHPFTIHAGECHDHKNVAVALNTGARRIGHGIAISGQAQLIDTCREHKIGIEMCPTSNLQTKAVDSLHEFPLREFLAAGLKVTVNTDNRTVSNTSLTREMALLVDNFGLTETELRQITANAADTAFASPEIKAKLRKKIWHER